MSETLSLVITVGSALLALASAAFSCFTYFKLNPQKKEDESK